MRVARSPLLRRMLGARLCAAAPRPRAVSTSGNAAVARWGGLGGVSPPKPERERGGGGGGGRGRDGWQDRPQREEWRSRPARPRGDAPRPREDAPAPVWREEGGDADASSSASSGWGDDDAFDDRPAPRAFRSGAGRGAPAGGDRGGFAGRAERRPGGWGSADGTGGDAPPARKWLTTRERRELDPAAPPTLASTLRGEALYGVAPVRAALAAGRRGAAYALFLQQSMELSKRKDASAVAAIEAAARAAGATVRHVDKHELNLLSDNRPHQGVVLDAAPLDTLPLSALPPWEAAQQQGKGVAPPVWVALDEVSDPQNLGAVLRSALFLGAAGVVVCARNSAPLSPAVSKASSGAVELLPVHACASMPAFLATSAENGWHVLGADAGPGADDVAAVSVARPTLLVLGSEGRGLRTNVRRECASLVCVPAGEQPPVGDAAVDSLNVSVAAGVLLHALLGAARRSVA